MPSTFTEFLQDRVLLRDAIATLILFLTVIPSLRRRSFCSPQAPE